MASEFRKPRKRRIVGGVDTHASTHHAAVVLMNGRRLADRRQAGQWGRRRGRAGGRAGSGRAVVASTEVVYEFPLVKSVAS